MRYRVAILAVLLLTGCSQERGVRFPVPMGEARRILAATGLPPEVFGHETPDFDVRAGDDDVTWTIHRNKVELFHYTAHLKTEDGGTRVSVDLVGAGSAAKGLKDHPAIAALYQVAVEERVASALEHRDFDMKRIYPALSVATLANMGNLRASADAAAEASNRQARENIEKAYRDEAAGH